MLTKEKSPDEAILSLSPRRLPSINYCDRRRSRLFSGQFSTGPSFPLRRREALFLGSSALLVPASSTASSGRETPSDYAELAGLIEKARKQLEPVPDLINAEKWVGPRTILGCHSSTSLAGLWHLTQPFTNVQQDSVRAILITPPLSDLWTKNGRPLLKMLAEAIGEKDGDEMAALEAREEAASHLQYLDMTCYNNNFSPVKTEGEAGSTKELVRAYYQMPVEELEASAKALDEFIELASVP